MKTHGKLILTMDIHQYMMKIKMSMYILIINGPI